jgi:hypothetical protein
MFLAAFDRSDTYGAGLFAFKILFLCGISQCLRLGVVSLPCE